MNFFSTHIIKCVPNYNKIIRFSSQIYICLIKLRFFFCYIKIAVPVCSEYMFGVIFFWTSLFIRCLPILNFIILYEFIWHIKHPVVDNFISLSVLIWKHCFYKDSFCYWNQLTLTGKLCTSWLRKIMAVIRIFRIIFLMKLKVTVECTTKILVLQPVFQTKTNKH